MDNCNKPTMLISLMKPEPGGYNPAISDRRVFTMRLSADVVATLVDDLGHTKEPYPVTEKFIKVINDLWRHDYGCGIIEGEEVSAEEIEYEPEDGVS